MNNRPSLIVMAAGLSSRFGRPKQLEPFGPSGEVLMEYSLYDALRAGFGKMVLVIHEEAETQFRAHLSDRIGEKLNIEYAYQKTDGSEYPTRIKPWGTGPAVLSAVDNIDGSFAAINADDFYGAEAFKHVADFLMNQPKTKEHSYCLPGYKLMDTLSSHGSVCRAVCDVDSDNRLLYLSEHTDIHRNDDQIISKSGNDHTIQLDGSQWVSMNFWGFTYDLFSHLKTKFQEFLRDFGNNPDKEFFLPDVINRLVQDGLAQVKVMPCRSRWFGVTYPHEKEQVTKKLRECISKGMYPNDLWQ